MGKYVYIVGGLEGIALDNEEDAKKIAKLRNLAVKKIRVITEEIIIKDLRYYSIYDMSRGNHLTGKKEATCNVYGWYREPYTSAIGGFYLPIGLPAAKQYKQDILAVVEKYINAGGFSTEESWDKCSTYNLDRRWEKCAKEAMVEIKALLESANV